MVQIAEDPRTRIQYAMKFYLLQDAFRDEKALYLDPDQPLGKLFYTLLKERGRGGGLRSGAKVTSPRPGCLPRARVSAPFLGLGSIHPSLPPRWAFVWGGGGGEGRVFPWGALMPASYLGGERGILESLSCAQLIAYVWVRVRISLIRGERGAQGSLSLSCVWGWVRRYHANLFS